MTNAFGDDTQECIAKIEKEITDRYKSLKVRLTKTYENQFKAILVPMVSPIENKIRLGEYKTPQDLIDDITKLKE